MRLRARALAIPIFLFTFTDLARLIATILQWRRLQEDSPHTFDPKLALWSIGVAMDDEERKAA